MYKKLLVFTGLWLMAQTVWAQPSYYPPLTGTTWATINASQLGFCQDRVDSLTSMLGSKNSKAFIMLVDGRIVIEQYYGTFTRDSAWYWASAGKSLTATMVGAAQSDGFLGIQDSTSKYLNTGWTSCQPTNERAVKIVHQLSMTTGLDENAAGGPDCTNPSCLVCLVAPGTRWAYHNAPYTLLDRVIASATGRTLNQYIFQKLGARTGLSGSFIQQGFNNVFFSTPRSFARFGLLMSGLGQWNGNSVIDSNWVKQMWTPSQTLNRSYGYLWWLNGQSSYMLPGFRFVVPSMLLPNAPTDAVNAIGRNGQICSISRDKRVVWIRMGNAPDSTTLVPISFTDEIWKYINRLPCITANHSMISKTIIKLSPNPVTDRLNLSTELDQALTYSIINGIGQRVKSGTLSAGTNSIDTRELNPNIYRIVIHTANEPYVQTFIKQ